jgi:hypothetical protein
MHQVSTTSNTLALNPDKVSLLRETPTVVRLSSPNPAGLQAYVYEILPVESVSSSRPSFCTIL